MTRLITARREAEEALKKVRDDLEAEVAEHMRQATPEDADKRILARSRLSVGAIQNPERIQRYTLRLVQPFDLAQRGLCVRQSFGSRGGLSHRFGCGLGSRRGSCGRCLRLVRWLGSWRILCQTW